MATAALGEKKSVQYLSVFILLLAIFSFNPQFNLFMFPQYGDAVYSITGFYSLLIIASMGIITYLSINHNIPQLPKIPPFWTVALNFTFFFLPLLFILVYIFQGTINFLPYITSKWLTLELIISNSENLLALLLFPVIMPWGKAKDVIKTYTFIKRRDYELKLSIPPLKNLKYYIPSNILIAFLHSGPYAKQVSSFTEFYVIVIWAFLMFMAFALIKESMGYGASVAAHTAYNLSIGVTLDLIGSGATAAVVS